MSLLKSLMGVDGWDDNKVRDHISKHGEMPKWDTDYDKIIVVSHSLGTIIGYDILRETFADLSKFAMPVEIDGIKTEAQPDKRRQMEEYLTNGVNKPKNKVDYDTDRYHQIQKDCFEELRSLGSPWIISDFVTLGSPLTHAEFLMSYDMDEMRHKQEARIFPTCPPTLEPNKTLKPNKNDDGYRFSYDSTYHQGDNKSLKFDHLHHAAHFAFTRWTNLFSKSKLILFGDLISGPVANHFDYAPRLKVEKEKNEKNEKNEKISLVGIRDIQVMPNETDEKNGVRTGFFTHNKYWKWRKKKQWIIENPAQPGKLPAHIRQLRSVLKLTEKPD